MRKKAAQATARVNEEAFFDALVSLAEENSQAASLEELTGRIEAAIEKAIKKSYPNCEQTRVSINMEEKRIEACVMKLVVDDDPLDDGEINIAQAKLIEPSCTDGDIISVPLNIIEFGRDAALVAKQSIKEDVKRIHRESILKKFEDKEFSIITVKVTRIESDSKNITVDYDHSELYLFPNEQLPNEKLKMGQLVKVYVTSISNKTKRPIIKISRAHRDLLKGLMTADIPEISDGTVVIKSIARDPGLRSKVSVYSNDPNVNAVSACIGKGHRRIQPITDELCGEKIDVINFSENPEEYIAAALSPAEITEVIITDERERTCTVAVEPSQLSLAIGNRGQNAKLAAKLTGYRIDIKSDSEFEAIGEANLLAEENRKKYAELAEQEAKEAAEKAALEALENPAETEEPTVE